MNFQQFRITKYDPRHRDESGAYGPDEWTSFSDIDDTFDGKLLTQEAYEQVEAAYLDVALALLQAAGIEELMVLWLENSQNCRSAPVEGATLSGDELRSAMRGVLRERYWCKFEGPNGCVHFGYDYYMYVGIVVDAAAGAFDAQAIAGPQGLFAEPFASPYMETD